MEAHVLRPLPRGGRKPSPAKEPKELPPGPCLCEALDDIESWGEYPTAIEDLSAEWRVPVAEVREFLTSLRDAGFIQYNPAGKLKRQPIAQVERYVRHVERGVIA